MGSTFIKFKTKIENAVTLLVNEKKMPLHCIKYSNNGWSCAKRLMFNTTTSLL